MNLTAITEYNEVILKHFLDSLSIVKVGSFDQKKLPGKSVIDIGTGAGFPGIPLKIAFPELKITLLDSLNKRVNFLNEVIEMLGLKDVTAVHGRAEDYAKQKEHREKIRLLCFTRSSQLKHPFRILYPFVKEGGSFISYKSGKIDEELSQAENAVKILGGKVRGCGEIPPYGHRYGPFFRCDQEDETDRQEVPQEGWLAGERATGVGYMLILR